MEIKGTALVSLQNFVRKLHKDRFEEWLNHLSKPSRAIMGDTILANNWYPLQDAVIEPTKKICDLFFDGNISGAWKTGEFAADHALRGIYRIFVKIGSPDFIIGKASKIMTTYYRPAEMKTMTLTSKSCVLQTTKFPMSDIYVEHRIGGWMEKALDISGCHGQTVKIMKSLAKGDPVTEYLCEWK